MHRLASHVAARPYAGSLRAATSGTSLLVVPPEATDWTRQGLRIDVGFTGAIRFVREKRETPKPDVFQAEAESIIDAFERFLRRAGWGQTPKPSER